MSAENDDFTADEVKEFSDGLKDPEVIKRIERFSAWRTKNDPSQISSEAEGSRTTPSAPVREITLSELKGLMKDPQTKSILKALLEMPDALEQALTGETPEARAMDKKNEKAAGRKASPETPAAEVVKIVKKWI
jgi:hypothetical protein